MKLPVLGEVPQFSYLDQHGNRIGNVDLLGRVWVADFIFTQCKTACPILSARMVALQRRVTHPDVRFVSFSVDPAHDTPAVLKAYVARWREERRWHLLSTNRRTLTPFLSRMGIVAQENDDPDDPILHSNGFLLVDAAGLIRGAYSSEDEQRMKQLPIDLESLAGASVAPAASAQSGRQLFVELGCPGCHADAKVANPLDGIFGSVVKLTDGHTLMADEAYLRESIVNPTAKVVAGFPASMPSYEGQLTEEQLDLLVGYIKTLASAKPAPPARTLAVDPVCKMEISADAETRQVQHGGKTYYFCSDACRDRFRRGPAQFGAR